MTNMSKASPPAEEYDHASKAVPDLTEKGSREDSTSSDANAVPSIGQYCLEDALACADAQYRNNDTISIEGDKQSPRASILSGPFRWSWLWGPESPESKHAPTAASLAHVDEQNVEAFVTKEVADRKALRQVTALGAFYLITTDILGPFNTGYAFSTVGYAPGVLLYFFLGVAAWYCGILLSSMYLRLDSDRFPIHTYGQLMQRILGKPGRIIADTLMIIQLVVNCGTLLLSNAQSLAQIIDGSNHHLCFAVCIVIFLIINLLLSPLRTLKGISYFSAVAVVLNVSLIFITIGFVSTSPPNYAAAMASFGTAKGPVEAVAFVKASLESKVNGAMNMVFAYGGAMIFVQFLGEMKRPWTFWKSMTAAQTFIFCLYMMFGLVVYSQQGQFTQSLAYYGVSKYAQQTVGNVFAVISGVIVALLYGNVAQKLCYSTIVERWLGGPALMGSVKGFVCWLGVNVVFWPVAFFVGAAIPQIQTISGLIAAIAILQFSYTFPFLCKAALDIQIVAMGEDPPHVVGQPPRRIDTWTSLSRWRRALFSGSIRVKVSSLFHFVLFLASLAAACLGMWGSGESIKATFSKAQATSFGCAPPA